MAKKDDKQKPPHTGSVAAEDPELTTWLHRLWHRGEPPQRIEVFQFFGRKNFVRGELIHHEDFKPGEKYDAEQANRLANEILAAAQHDCDCTPSAAEMNYLLVVKDNNRTATPLTRRLGPVTKKRQLLENLEKADEDDDEEPLLGGKSLSLRYITGMLEQIRWKEQRADSVVGEMMLLLKDRGDRAEARTEALMDRVLGIFDKLQIAEDRSLDRSVVRQNSEFNLYLKKEGVRTVRNLLPGIFAAAKGEDQPPPNGSDNNSGSNGATTPPPNGGTKDYGSSRERTLLDGFFADVEDVAQSTHPGLDIALFGDYERGPNGERVEKQKGIFSFEQCYILVGVRAGHLPVTELDKLIPKAPSETKSGLEITEAQIIAAGSAGVSQGMGTALAEIVGLRNARRQQQQINAAPADAAPTHSEGP